jgi:transposase
MKMPVKFVSSLSEEQINNLKEVVKQSPNSRCRTRAQAILLSSEQVSIDPISQICDIGRDAVSTWIDHWEQLGIKGLSDLPRPGGPGLLTDSDKQLLLELATQEPRSIVTLRAQLVDLTGKRVSPSTITRILKAAGYVWKSIKKTLKDRRPEEEFEAAQVELQELKQQHQAGDVELWFFDESGFDGQPSVPYAWQLPGSPLEVPAKRTTRINVLGFLTQNNQFESFCFEGTINSAIVIACFEEFIRLRGRSLIPRIIVLDQSSTHTSDEVLAKLPAWEKKGVILKFLPAHCSELNLIEILWRFIKYSWLPFSAYLSFDNLVKELENILTKIGAEFRVNFAS